MARHLWRERVLAVPKIHHGDPCIRGTRIPVAMILGSLADGLPADEIIAEYPQLTREDVRAALEYAAEVTHEDAYLPLAR